MALKIGGAAVLGWLAYRAAASALAGDPRDAVTESETRSRAGWFWRGVALNGLNPKALAAWGAIFVMGTAGAPIFAIWALSSLLGFVVYLGYSGLFSLAPVRRVYARMRRIAEAVVAAVFGAAAIRLLFWRTEAT